MSNYRIWPIAALVIAVLLFVWKDDDEQPEPDKSANQENPSFVTPSPSRQTESYNPRVWNPSGGYQAPVDIYGNYSSGYPRSDEYSPNQSAYPGGLRFREPSDSRVSANPYAPSQIPQPGQDLSNTMGDPTFQNLPGYGALQQPGSNYSFRPLDKKQKKKRWNGNFGPMQSTPQQPSSPYPYNRYPAPAYPHQSPPEPDPLWANSWPDR